MFWKQKGKCLLFLYILTLKLTILRPCLGSAGIKTFATAGDFNKKSQTSGHFDEVDRVYSKMDGKWGRFGRLIFGRAAQNVKVAVSVDTTRKDGLLKNQLGSYGEYGDVPLVFSARSSSDTANSARQSYQQISTSLNLSRSLDAEPKTESFSTVIPGGTREQNENVTMKDWSSQSDGDNVGCTLGEIDWKPLADKEDTTRTGSKKYQDGYQSDSAPRGVEESRVAQGEVTALYPSSGSPVPLVQCGSNNMSLTVRRSEAAHLLVDQGKPPPLPLSQLPPHCGYSVKTTQRDLVFMALYDGCHVRQQDGSYILQLLWWGTRVKMSCLVSPPPLSLCCNPFGMTITIGGSGSADEIGVEMDREWRPLTSVALQCGYIMETHPGKVVVSVPFTGCGVTIKDGKHTLSIRSREKESTVSCPFLPSAPSPSPALRPTPLPAIPEQYPKFPMFYWLQPHYPVATPPAEITHAYHPPSFPHFYHKVPILYPQRPPKPVTHLEDPPAPNPSMDLLIPLSISHTPQYPANPHSVMPDLHSRQPPDPVTKPTARSLVPDDCKIHNITPSPTTRPPLYPATGPLSFATAHPPPPYNLISLLHPEAPGNPPKPLTTRPPSIAHPSPPPPPHPQSHLTGHQFYPPLDTSHQPPDPMNSPSHPLSHPAYRPSSPFYLRPQYPHPTPPHPTASHLQPSTSPYFPATQPARPQVPPPSHLPRPSVSCKPNEMTVTLPSAHPASIEVKDQSDVWIPIGSADPACSYRLHIGELGVLSLSLPLPACHRHTLSPSLISLYLRFWDMALGELLVLDLKCPYSPGSSTQSLPTERPTAHKPQGYCMADHMSVGLPPGVRDVIVQDIKGNKIRLQEAPEDCGYTVRKDNSGDIMLNLPFTSCLMTIQGQDHIIGIKVLSEHGLGAEWLSCPVAQPNTKQGHMADDGGVSQPEESPSYQPKGEFGVQLRISTDQNYTSYYPQNRRRFQLLLGRPLFLEVRLLNAPYPTLALLVHYCLAYSSSTKAPWLLIYDSCPGRPDRQSPPPPVPPSPVRRFTITTFQRLPSGYFSPNEEINFMCSTAVCSQSERPCVEGCFT